MRLVATKTSNGRADESPGRPWKGPGNRLSCRIKNWEINRSLRVDKSLLLTPPYPWGVRGAFPGRYGRPLNES